MPPLLRVAKQSSQKYSNKIIGFYTGDGGIQRGNSLNPNPHTNPNPNPNPDPDADPDADTQGNVAMQWHKEYNDKTLSPKLAAMVIPKKVKKIINAFTL